MNQIRAGAAIGILLLSIPPLIEKKLFKFILLILIAAQFHFSALIFLPLYFLNSTKINKIYYFLIPASYVLYILGIGLIELLSQINVSFLQGKIEAYKLLLDQGMYSKLNVFNPLALIRIALIYLFLYNWETLAAKNPYFIIMLKVYIFSVVVMVLLAGLPAFALRVSDMFSIMEILLIPFLFYLFRSKYTALLIVLGLCGLFLFLDLFYNKFLDPYSLI
jgi:hypothetical protein